MALKNVSIESSSTEELTPMNLSSFTLEPTKASLSTASVLTLLVKAASAVELEELFKPGVSVMFADVGISCNVE